ncbi:MAG: pilus assembly protein PilM [Pseudomonadaceae bacterium]|nr:pilus assembly protein PilM [Pseudomonadaceae bacterium]
MNLAARWNGLLKGGTKYGAIGLEISLTEIHVAQLSRGADGLRLCAFGSSNHGSNPESVWQDEKHFRSLVRGALKEHGCRGNRVIAALPASLARVMPVSYQPQAGESDAAAIASLLKDRIGSEAEDFVIDYMPVDTLAQGKTKLALVALCREETIIGFLNALSSAGLSVEALEIGPIAIQRLIKAQQADLPAQNTLVVNCGRQKTYLTLLADQRLLADDEISFGEDNLLERLASSLDIEAKLARKLALDANLDPSTEHANGDAGEMHRAVREIVRPEFKRLASEIERGLIYASSESRGSRRSCVYLLGSFARWPGAGRLLESLMSIPVTVVPSPVTAFGDDRQIVGPEYAVATGLALHGLDDLIASKGAQAA